MSERWMHDDKMESDGQTRDAMASLQASIDALLAEVRKGRDLQRAILSDAHEHLVTAVARSLPRDDEVSLGHVAAAKSQLALVIEQSRAAS